jgi:membrane fusion protein (multidrug efflux system)
VTARAAFANPGERIKPGMLLRVGVVQGARQALAVPESAVLFEGDAAFVYAVAPRGAGGGGSGAGSSSGSPPGGAPGGGLAAQRRPVETGARQNGLVEIISGLREGERIVAEGLNRVNPNQPVRIAGAEGAGPARTGAAGPGGASRRAAP